MDTNSSFMLLDLISLGCGAYCLYTWLKLLIGKKLFKNGLLVPKEKKLSDCSDEQAYIAYMMPSLAVTAITTSIYGVVFLLNDLLGQSLIPFPWGFLPLVLVMGALVWFAICNSKANKMYFGM